MISAHCMHSLFRSRYRHAKRFLQDLTTQTANPSVNHNSSIRLRTYGLCCYSRRIIARPFVHVVLQLRATGLQRGDLLPERIPFTLLDRISPKLNSLVMT